MKNDRDLVDVIRSIAAGSSVDWDAASATPADASTQSVLDQLKVIARIAEVHGVSRSDAALEESEDGRLQSWGPLTVLEPIGHGAYGDVYRAWDSRLDRDVALKLLRQGGAPADADLPAIEEGRLLARVRHPNVVTVHGADRIDGRVGIWMEFVQGKGLDQLVREAGPMSAADAVAIGVEICRGVAAVHGAGLVHRDIKAQNVMRQENGRIVLMDFGTGRTSDTTHAHSITGTPLYLAPEVLAGEPATPASDLYSVGVLLYYLLTGSFPVAGRTLADVREAHGAGQTASTRRTRPSVPRRLATIIDRAIDPVPGARFADATAMERALRRCQTAPRRYALTVAALVVLTTIATATWMIGRAGQRAPKRATAGMTVRQIDWPFNWFVMGAPSADGHWLPYVDGRTGNVALLDLRTGATRLVTNDADWNRNRFATTAALSPDGTAIAHSWYRADGAAVEIDVIDLASGRQRTLVHDDTLEDVPRIGWSHDGRALLLRVETRDGDARMELVDVADGARKVLKPSWPSAGAAAAAFSPDDRFVVYDEPATAPKSRDLRIIEVASRQDALLLGGPDDDAEPQWMGRTVLFTSNRSGQRGLWQLPMDERRAASPPTIVTDQLAVGFWPIGITAAGSFFYAAAEGVSSVFVADCPSGDEVTTPVRLSASEDPALSPEWSPDARAIAWIARSRANGAQGATLLVHNLDSGRERTITTPFVLGQNPRWSPDGTQLLLRGSENDVDGLRLIDASTNSLTRSYLTGRQFGDVEWSADGTAAFFLDFKQRFIARLEIGTSVERIVYRLPGNLVFTRGLSISPDGATIAFGAFDADVNALYTVPSRGGSARTVLTWRAPLRLQLQEWTRDGRRLLVTRSRSIPGATSSQEWQLWSVDVASGDQHYLDFSMPGLNSVRPSTDGRRITFASSNAENRLRVIDNVPEGIH